MVLDFLVSFLAGKTKCTHEHVGLDKDFGYCPDCGALVENEWYIVKCPCCGIKHKAIVKNGKVVPVNNFCHNCGTEEYVVEKLDTIDFININYAALIRKENQQVARKSVTQCWVNTKEKTFAQPKLLPQFR